MLRWGFRTHKHHRALVDEAHKEARLEDAERTLEDLKTRKERAVRILGDRQSRNHWRESIEKMIQGV